MAEANTERQIFREKSLEGLSTPERLDQLLRIVRPQSWLLLLAVGFGFVVVGVWTAYGRIPATASGTAILVRPKQVVGFQAPASGPIASLEVEVGQVVEVGVPLAYIQLPALREELEQERAKLQLFEDSSSRMSSADRAQAERERDVLSRKRESIERWVAKLEESAELSRNKYASYATEQRSKIKAARVLSEELGVALSARYDAHKQLAEDKINSYDALVKPQSALLENRLRLAELDLKEQALELREIDAAEEYDARQGRIEDLRFELSDIQLREMAITSRLLKDELDNTSERETIKRRIKELEALLETESRVVSAHAGRILEITTTVGQHVALGQRLGKMEIEDPSAGLKAIAYFQIKDGKKIQPGRHRLRITPSTVERERFGAMIGTVLSVSDYPVTTAAAANQIGDLETARTLLGGMTRIEVVSDLEEDGDTLTGYKWTSGKGPQNVFITAGTTAEVRVTLEEIAPYTLILPFLKSLLDD